MVNLAATAASASSWAELALTAMEAFTQFLPADKVKAFHDLGISIGRALSFVSDKEEASFTLL